MQADHGQQRDGPVARHRVHLLDPPEGRQPAQPVGSTRRPRPPAGEGEAEDAAASAAASRRVGASCEVRAPTAAKTRAATQQVNASQRLPATGSVPAAA